MGCRERYDGLSDWKGTCFRALSVQWQGCTYRSIGYNEIPGFLPDFSVFVVWLDRGWCCTASAVHITHQSVRNNINHFHGPVMGAHPPFRIPKNDHFLSLFGMLHKTLQIAAGPSTGEWLPFGAVVFRSPGQPCMILWRVVSSKQQKNPRGSDRQELLGSFFWWQIWMFPKIGIPQMNGFNGKPYFFKWMIWG